MVHPHIVYLRWVSHHNGAIVLELDALPGGDLATWMRAHYPNGAPEYVARWYFQQIALAVDYCHASMVCNRDIKLKNIVLAAPAVAGGYPHAKLCDFGWSKDEANDSTPHTQAGSPAYVAPEIIAGGGEAKYEGAAADAWSLGVVLYCLLVGHYPFERPEDESLRTSLARMQAMAGRIQAVQFSFPPDDGSAGPVLSPGARDLITRLLDRDPATRLRVNAAMRHTWTFEGCAPGLDTRTREFNVITLRRDAEDTVRQQRFAARIVQADAVFRELGWDRTSTISGPVPST